MRYGYVRVSPRGGALSRLPRSRFPAVTTLTKDLKVIVGELHHLTRPRLTAQRRTLPAECREPLGATAGAELCFFACECATPKNSQPADATASVPVGGADRASPTDT